MRKAVSTVIRILGHPAVSAASTAYWIFTSIPAVLALVTALLGDLLGEPALFTAALVLGFLAIGLAAIGYVRSRSAQNDSDRSLLRETATSGSDELPVGIRIKGGRNIQVDGNYVEGYSTGISIEDSSESSATRNVVASIDDLAYKGRLARHPRRFSRRDDAGDLAKRCLMLAGSLERWIQSFATKRAEDTAALVDEMLGADPDLDPEELRRKAEARYEKRWERDYRHKYGAEAKKLFEEAWEMHEVAKELEQLATCPLAIQFEEVPKLFGEIAESLYANAA